MRHFTNKQLGSLIIPLILEQILGVTVGMADIVMVSEAGEAAVAGVSLVDTINVLLINLFTSLATGGAVVASRYLGEKNEEKSCRAANQLLLSITSVSLIVMSIALVGNQYILHLIFGSVESSVMNNAIIYFYLTALSFPFLAIYSGSAALCRSMGNSKITMMTSVLVNIINITGNAILVYGAGMGAGGVGTATLISRMAGALVMLYVVHNQSRPIHIDVKFRLGIDLPMIRKIFRIGVPTGLDNSIFQIGKILVQNLVAGFGTSALAANAIVNTVSGFTVIPASAIGLSLITVVGQCIGARAYDDVKYFIKKLMKTAYIAMAVLNIAIILLSRYIIGFYQLSPETSSMAWRILVSYSICAMILWPSGFSLPNALRAADDARFTMIVSIASMWTWRVGLSYILSIRLGMGLYGIWAAMYVDWICRSALFIIRVKKGRWAGGDT